jgi:Lon protease-like protein
LGTSGLDEPDPKLFENEWRMNNPPCDKKQKVISAMTLFQNPAELPEKFAGVVRLFPLPNFVMFPNVVHALHIFEPRYRELLEDALAGDQLIAMARLQHGWEQDYEGRPPIFPVVCLGRVAAHARLNDGRYNILLHGMKRASIIREFPPEQSFRLAEVAILDDVYPSSGAPRRARMQRDLLRSFQRLAPESPTAHEQIEQLLGQQISLGALVDVIGFTLAFDLDFKQELLTQWNVDIRSAMLLEKLQQLGDQKSTDWEPPFPPEFSNN